MNGSIIIFGSNQSARSTKALEIARALELEYSENNHDIKVVETPEDKKSIGIDEVREITKFLSNKPFSHKNKAVIIAEAHLMTREAQNALLKTLEEPPSFATLILLAKTEESVLPTVLSRCQKIGLSREINAGIDKNETGKGSSVSFIDLLNQNTGKKLEWASETAKMDKKEIINLLEKLISEGRNSLNEYRGSGVVALLNNLNKVRQDLENTNINTKIALEFLATNI